MLHKGRYWLVLSLKRAWGCLIQAFKVIVSTERKITAGCLRKGTLQWSMGRRTVHLSDETLTVYGLDWRAVYLIALTTLRYIKESARYFKSTGENRPACMRICYGLRRFLYRTAW